MLFYKVSAIIDDEKLWEENIDRRAIRERTRQIATKTILFNQTNGRSCFCFVSEIDNDEITCGIIAEDLIDMLKTARDFFDALSIKIKNEKQKVGGDEY